jgi:hypothetical protein
LILGVAEKGFRRPLFGCAHICGKMEVILIEKYKGGIQK